MDKLSDGKEPGRGTALSITYILMCYQHLPHIPPAPLLFSYMILTNVTSKRPCPSCDSSTGLIYVNSCTSTHAIQLELGNQCTSRPMLPASLWLPCAKLTALSIHSLTLYMSETYSWSYRTEQRSFVSKTRVRFPVYTLTFNTTLHQCYMHIYLLYPARTAV